MKKIYIILAAFHIAVCITACQGTSAQTALEATQEGTAEVTRIKDEFEKTTQEKQTEAASEEQTETTQEKAISKSSEGEESYEVPTGWVKADKYSTKNKIFYVQEGHEDDAQPDNISIEIGKNKYSSDDHLKFRDAILNQLMMQLKNAPDTMLYGDGTYTDQGYTLYIFTIEEETTGIVTRQYYIVGDMRYCLIHLTNFSGSEECAQAARAIADSFVWESGEEGGTGK